VAFDNFLVTSGEIIDCCGNGVVEAGEQCVNPPNASAGDRRGR
jgi:hypothetical protein